MRSLCLSGKSANLRSSFIWNVFVLGLFHHVALKLEREWNKRESCTCCHQTVWDSYGSSGVGSRSPSWKGWLGVGPLRSEVAEAPGGRGSDVRMCGSNESLEDNAPLSAWAVCRCTEHNTGQQAPESLVCRNKVSPADCTLLCLQMLFQQKKRLLIIASWSKRNTQTRKEKTITVCYSRINTFVMQSTPRSDSGHISLKMSCDWEEARQYKCLSIQSFTLHYLPLRILHNYSELTHASGNASRCGTYRAILKARW